MKMKSYQSILKTTFAVVVLSTLVSGCKKDFFNLEDPNGISSDIWNDVGAVTQFIDKGYDLMMPTWPTPGGIHNTSDESTNSWIGWILTGGEGWHNNHHHSPGNYRQGEKWWEWDPSADFIKLIKISDRQK
jgi:hypothetical protein